MLDGSPPPPLRVTSPSPPLPANYDQSLAAAAGRNLLAEPPATLSAPQGCPEPGAGEMPREVLIVIPFEQANKCISSIVCMSSIVYMLIAISFEQANTCISSVYE